MNNKQLTVNNEKRTNKYSLFFVLCYLFFACSMPESSVTAPSYDPDLFEWKVASMAPFSVNETVNDFAYGKIRDNDCYVALSSFGGIAWSENGDIWHRCSRRIECERVIQAVHCGEILFIGLQDTSYTCSVPDEKGNLVTLPKNAPGAFNAVTFGNGVFAAVGNIGYIARSENGKEWTIDQRIIGSNIEMRGIAFGGGTFVSVGNIANKGVIFYSEDGVLWDRGYENSVVDTRLNSVAYEESAGVFYVVGNYLIWGEFSIPPYWSPLGPNIITTEARKITASSSGPPTLGIILDRDLGNDQWFRRPIAIQREEAYITWDRNCTDPDCSVTYCFRRVFWKPELFRNPRNNGNININDIAFGGGYFVAVADAAMIGHLSGNLSGNVTALYQGGDRFWNALHIPEFMETNFTAIEALNGRFFIGNNTGKIGYSK